MPTYEYVCRSCEEHVEVVQSFRDDPLETCGLCGGQLRKVFSAAGIIFKGSGYYVTDTRKQETKADGDSKSDSGGKASESSASTSGSEGGSSDAAASA